MHTPGQKYNTAHKSEKKYIVSFINYEYQIYER